MIEIETIETIKPREGYVDPTETLSWKIRDFYHNILQPFKTFYRGCYNFWVWRKIIWNDRFWDYSYLNEIIIFKLKEMEKFWGVDTHFQGDKFTKLRLQVLIKRFETLEEDIWNCLDTSHLNNLSDEDKQCLFKIARKREKYLIDRAFKVLGRNHRRFWD